MIDKEKVVDLSHRILRRGENFPFHSDYIGNRSSKDWYVMSNIFIGSHVGTHVEVPKHHVRDGLDCLHYPLENLVGDCVTLDCSGKEVDEPITLEEVSGHVSLNPAYFSVLFKKTEGEGFAKYLIHLRMEQAKILLRDTNEPVSAICQRVGYHDVKHFTRTFEKDTGVKPATYRKLYG